MKHAHCSIDGTVTLLGSERLYLETGHVSFDELHPDTDPERIREIQTRDVELALLMYGPMPVDELSELVVLPKDIVRRALKSLGQAVATTSPKPKKQTHGEKMLAALASGKWQCLAGLMKLTGGTKASVVNWLYGNGRRLERKDRKSTMGQVQRYWRLKAGGPAANQ